VTDDTNARGREPTGPPGPTEPLTPSQIGPYRLHELLGEGGMGEVYRATQSEPVRREVALKIIKPGMDTKEVVARFQSERQALAVMDHSSIAKVLDAGATEAGRPYFVMELVRGVPLDEYCDVHKLSTVERLELFIRVCEAVHHAHQKGVVHRDLKPSNVLVTVQDDKPIPKVIDFGIAKAVGHALTDHTLATTVGQMLGTPAYMSPEQAEQSGLDVDTRTDVYALGVMLYELLSGTLPFDSKALSKPDFVLQWLIRERDVPTPSARLASLLETQQTVARNRRTDVRTLRRELRGDLDWIVMKAMEKDRTRRYDAASQFAADLRRFLDAEPVSARPPSAGYRLRKFARRHRGALAAGVVLVLALVGGSALATVGFVRAARSAARASAAADRAQAVNAFLDQMLRAADPVRGGEAETTVREVLDAASQEVTGGALEDSPLVEAAVRRSIGGTYMHLGLLDEAEQHLEQSWALLRTTPGAEDLERVAVLDELGQIRVRQGDAGAAEELYRLALALADSAGLSSDGGAGESTVNSVRNDLGLALRDMDRIDEAAEVLEALAASERRIRAPDDVELASTLNNLALVKRAQGDIQGAIDLFGETLGVLRAAFGERHVYVATVMESIGSLEQRMGRYAAADSLMTAALDMRREILGDRHRDIANGLNALGLLHTETGESDEADAYFQEALAMSLDMYGEGHPLTASVLNNIGVLHLQRVEATEAEVAFRRALSIREDVLGERHRYTLNTRANLAAAILLSGRAEEAAALAGEAVQAEREIGLTDAALQGAALVTWGRALTELGRFQEAEAPLLEAYEIQEDALGAEHARTRKAIEALVALYEAWGMEEQAVEWRER
jgi:serine/threonine protein kinase/tetratricopeptide (TPR) repeat protein